MADTGTQKARNQCSRCGRVFDSQQALQEHEKECKGRAGSNKPEGAKKDMLIEDRFEASDN